MKKTLDEIKTAFDNYIRHEQIAGAYSDPEGGDIGEFDTDGSPLYDIDEIVRENIDGTITIRVNAYNIIDEFDDDRLYNWINIFLYDILDCPDSDCKVTREVLRDNGADYDISVYADIKIEK